MPNSTIKLVVLEDNPLILDILQRGLALLGEIKNFTYSKAALAE
jgi:hypothetical protein